MMRRVKYGEIDFEKYGRCIEDSAQRKYCATREFLDISCGEKWEVIVKGNYDAVMPVTFVKKMGLKIVVHPVLCQQLGIFSKTDDAQQNQEFLDFLLNDYRVAYYAFNDGNAFINSPERRTNFILKSAVYAEVLQKYSPKRRRKLRIDADLEQIIIIKRISWEQGIAFMAGNVPGLYNDALKNEFFRILKQLYERSVLELEAFLLNDQIINMVAIYRDQKTAVLVGTFNDRENMKLNGASILIDRAIERHIATTDFDFEGSDVPAIAEFFRGFRPELKTYPVIRNSRKELVKTLFRQTL